METIQKSSCRKLGYFQKPHGIKGAVTLSFEPQYDLSLENEPVLLVEIDGLLVPHFIEEEGLRFRSSESAIVQLTWVDDDEKARQLSGLSVYLKEEDIVEPEEELTIHHLVGFGLFDQHSEEIGTIEKVEDYGGNLLFVLQYQGREILVPFNEDLLIDLDEKEKKIVMQIPEGILELE
jgi:16S rRNA processing protein RimM